MTDESPTSGADNGLPDAAIIASWSAPDWSPLMREYLALRAEANCLLAYHLGDFCEFFFEDAEIVSRICNVALTSRGFSPDGRAISMCGLPAPAGITNDTGSQIRFLGSSSHYYAAIVQAGYPLAFAVWRPGGREIVARFDPVASDTSGTQFSMPDRVKSSGVPEMPDVPSPVAIRDTRSVSNSVSRPTIVETPITRLFAQRLAILNKMGADPDSGDDECDWAEYDQIEKEILALPCVTAADLAVHLLVKTSHGDFEFEPRMLPICEALLEPAQFYQDRRSRSISR